ncbi:hypothetical protein B0G73_106197 [Paraburkholderia sp. BL25I1N1]|nr:hypothetical protein B0G73_106197 [Paraburkholderia sp. BL25I1N1]
MRRSSVYPARAPCVAATSRAETTRDGRLNDGLSAATDSLQKRPLTSNFGHLLHCFHTPTSPSRIRWKSVRNTGGEPFPIAGVGLCVRGSCRGCRLPGRSDSRLLAAARSRVCLDPRCHVGDRNGVVLIERPTLVPCNTPPFSKSRTILAHHMRAGRAPARAANTAPSTSPRDSHARHWPLAVAVFYRQPRRITEPRASTCAASPRRPPSPPARRCSIRPARK